MEITGFRAKAIYSKLGYSVPGVLQDFPSGRTSHNLQKLLQVANIALLAVLAIGSQNAEFPS
ncbi:MAG: hypothetical protein WBV39_06645 [Rudaea sp.]